ncbi:MAG: hypothetical protein OXB93_00975, partial [Cytophagales bacterium]|nr:hypothetical protein [Cytophagales bacterium]
MYAPFFPYLARMYYLCILPLAVNLLNPLVTSLRNTWNQDILEILQEKGANRPEKGFSSAQVVDLLFAKGLNHTPDRGLVQKSVGTD